VNIEAVVAVSGLALTVILAGGGVIFQLGKHSQRIDALEEKTKDLPAVAVLTAIIGEMKVQLAEVSHDVKNLLTGRVQPPSRRRTGED